MVTRRAAKSKGSQFEIDCEHSLRKVFPDIRRMGGEGQFLQYDLRTDVHKRIFECKRLKGISWNQCVKYLKKMESVAPRGYECYLLFKSNFQPCLVMYRWNGDIIGDLIISEFEREFGTTFIKHKSTRARK